MGSPAIARLRPLLLVVAGGVSLGLVTCVINRAREDAALRPEPAPRVSATAQAAAALSQAPLPSASAPATVAAPAASLAPTRHDFEPLLPSSKSGLPLREPAR